MLTFDTNCKFSSTTHPHIITLVNAHFLGVKGAIILSIQGVTNQEVASAIIQNKFNEIGRINQETREVNLNGDDKRFWLGRLVDINDKKSNNSTPLNPEFFAERFELNNDFQNLFVCEESP